MSQVKSLPTSDRDLCTLAAVVYLHWQSSGLALQWMSFADFLALVQNYESHLGTREIEGSMRPAITMTLQNLEEEMDKNLTYVKSYIQEKFGKQQAVAYYAQFGIVHKGRNYILPHDREHRLSALALMVQGLQTHGFTTQNYGLVYWQNMQTQYKNNKQSAIDTDSNVSAYVSDKNTDRVQIVRVLRAILNLLQAQYPDTYISVMRQWGFQKEKY